MAQMRRLGTSAVNQRLALVGTSLYEYKVLMLLVNEPEVAQHDVVFDCGMDKAAVSRLIRTFTEQGLVTVRVDPADKRQRLLKITAKGRVKEAMLAPIVDEALAPFMAGLSDQEGEEFLRLMRKAYSACLEASREQALNEGRAVNTSLHPRSLPSRPERRSIAPEPVSKKAPERERKAAKRR
jgi:DNA-binding MarR family transcriptional regulator